jgi:hypothetical protein
MHAVRAWLQGRTAARGHSPVSVSPPSA